MRVSCDEQWWNFILSCTRKKSSIGWLARWNLQWKERKGSFFLSFSAFRWLDGIMLCIIQGVEFVIAQGMNGWDETQSKRIDENGSNGEMNEWKAPRYFHSAHNFLHLMCVYHLISFTFTSHENNTIQKHRASTKRWEKKWWKMK